VAFVHGRQPRNLRRLPLQPERHHALRLRPAQPLAGPTVGAAATATTALVQAGNAVAEGKDTHLAAKLINIGKGFIPAQN